MAVDIPGNKPKVEIPAVRQDPIPNLAYVQKALNHLDGAMAIINSEGKIIFINSHNEVCQSLLSTKLAIGNSIFENIPEEWRSMGMMMMNDAATSGLPVSIDLQRNGPHQTKLFFELTCKVLPEDENASRMFLIQAHEITARKILQKKLESAGSEMSTLIENANAIIIATDSRDHITEWNKAASEITGYERHEALMQKLHTLIIDNIDPLQSTSSIQGLLEGRSLSNFEIPVKAKDGRQLTFLINGAPKLNVTGQVIGVLIVGQDITELISYRKSLEDKVEERTQELNDSYQEIKLQKKLVDEAHKKSDQLLLNILPGSVAAELKEKGHVIPRHYKLTSILFADMAGFAEMSTQLAPDVVIYELNYIFTGFDMILERHNMEKIKTIGDGYLAVGGLPVENETNATDAVSAALEIIYFTERVRRENQKSGRPAWEVRVGIHTGELVAGVIGKNKFVYDVWGSSVNTASRMEAAGHAGKINISQSTYELVNNEFECTFRGEVQVKSLGRVKMYFVNGRKS